MTLEPRSLADELGVANLDEALAYLRDGFIKNTAETDRRNHAALIDAQLAHTGDYAVDAYLMRALKDPVNRQEHRDLLPWSRVNALLRRVAEETGTAYDEPATRTVRSGQAQFDALSKALGLDLVMRAANRLLVAHEAAWLALRVRDDEPILDVLTPARFWAVHPVGDPTHLVGIVTEIPRPPKPSSTDPAYRFAGRWQTLVLNEKCELLSSEDNPLAPALPGVLVALEPATVTQRLLPERANGDLVAAETAGAFSTLIGLREVLTVQKQAYLSGDTSALALGQSAGSQREVILTDGVSVTAVDRAVDVAQYQRHADSLADIAGANAGLAPESRKLTSATSGYELWLRMVPLVKRRREQIDVLRGAEERLAMHMAQVIEHLGLDQYAYDPTGFAIQFGEVSMPLSESEELANFETRRKLLLDDTVSEEARRNQIDEDAAAANIAARAERETARVAMLQRLSAMNANSATAVGDNTNRGAEPVNPGEKETVQQ